MRAPSSLLERFAESARAVGAHVSMAEDASLGDILAGLLPSDGLVLVSPELPSLAESLLAQNIEARPALEFAGAREPLSAAFERAAAGVTPALAGIASSGTVAIGPSGRNGGLLAALPPQHVVVLKESDIHASLADALALFARRFSEWAGEMVLVTGPSRTADIEMMTVLGVHGPLRLDVVVLQGT